MFQFPRFPSRGLCVHPPTPQSTCVAAVGFPIRTSPDIAPAHGSPRLFAVFHVLLRRLTPRHPPYALSSFLHVMRRNCVSTLAACRASRHDRRAIRLLRCRARDKARGRGRLRAFRTGLGGRAAVPSAGAERFQSQRWSAKRSRAWPPSLIVFPPLTTPTGKTARLTAGLFLSSRCDLPILGYSVPEAVRDDNGSFFPRLTIGRA